MHYRVSDWDDAYANGPNIAGGERWPAAWIEPARSFRQSMLDRGGAEIDLAYGNRGRNRYDLFRPAGAPRGLLVFIHGGFWLRLDKSYWSHLAAGPLSHGFAVAIPSYTLCPDVRIAEISREVARMVQDAASKVSGPVHLVGHSAGGQLATRLATMTGPLASAVRERLAAVVSISGLHDLRPLMRTAMNSQIGLDLDEANTESPALLTPLPDLRLTCWVGAGERAEFVRQNALLANIWSGLGSETRCVEEPDRHHFNVIDGLADPHHDLTAAAVDV